jgi:glycosyltransferase involved in cell wall biosynthesis
MKVVHLASSGELGGAEAVVLDILAGMREARPGWALELIVPARGPLEARAADLGVTVKVITFGANLERLGDALVTRGGILALGLRTLAAVPATIAYVVRLRRALRATGPSIVHTHGAKMQLLGLWTRPRGVPLVMHLHDYIGRRPMVSRLLRLRRLKGVVGVAISESVAEDANHALGSSAQVRVVHNGIDTSHWTPNGSSLDLDALSGLAPAPNGTVRVGLVATMARWKGHEVFLEALSLLQRKAGVRGYVVGGSIYRTGLSQYAIDELRAIANRYQLEGRVGFTGYIDDPASAMRALDIVVHASTLPEPFGRVIVEGMATERPVVSTSIGGAAELVEHDVWGLSVRPNDPASLADAISRLAEDPEARRRLGTAGRARVFKAFNRSVMVQSLLQIYQTLTPKR